MYMQTMAFNPFATVHQTAQRMQAGIRRKTGELFQGLDRTHLVGYRANPANAGNDIYHFRVMPTLQEFFEQSRWFEYLQF